MPSARNDSAYLRWMQSLFNSLEEALSDIIAEAQASGETVSDETLKDLLEQTKVEAAGRIKKTLYKRAKGMPVSYTHLTLPTNREV